MKQINTMKQYVIFVWCKDCAQIEKFVFRNQSMVELNGSDISTIIRTFLRDDYRYSLTRTNDEKALQQHLYESLTMPSCFTVDALIRRCKTLRLKRYVRTIKTVVTKELVDKLANPIPLGRNGIMIHNMPWADRDTFNGYDYTFFKGMFIPGLMELLRYHHIYVGITKYGDVYACGKFDINWERHPLFRNGVFRIERIKETTCTITEIIQDK